MIEANLQKSFRQASVQESIMSLPHPPSDDDVRIERRRA